MPWCCWAGSSEPESSGNDRNKCVANRCTTGHHRARVCNLTCIPVIAGHCGKEYSALL